MNRENDKKSNIQTSEQFSKDLNSLFEPQQSVSPQIDRAVMDEATRRLRYRSGSRWRYYWPACAAAAAMIVTGVLFLNFNKPDDISAPVALQKDINQDGTVDILDAFKLARHIKSPDSMQPSWDVNGDGVIDQKDVDTVAMVAVKMKEGVL